MRRRAENGATESFADGVGGAPPRGPPATSGTPADHPGSARGCDAAGGGEGIPADPGSTEPDRGYPSRSSERRYAENVSLLARETARFRADLERVRGERDAARVETLAAKEEAREAARAFSARVESLEREVRDLRSEVARREEELADQKRSYAAISFSAASEALRRSRAEANLHRVSEECAKLRAKCEAAAATRRRRSVSGRPRGERPRLGARGFSFRRFRSVRRRRRTRGPRRRTNRRRPGRPAEPRSSSLASRAVVPTRGSASCAWRRSRARTSGRGTCCGTASTRGRAARAR